MKLCFTCYRLNPGEPVYCMGCGVALGGVRRCLHCAHPNEVDARYCGRCGRADLSEADKPIPLGFRVVAWVIYALSLAGAVVGIMWIMSFFVSFLLVVMPLLVAIAVIWIFFEIVL